MNTYELIGIYREIWQTVYIYLGSEIIWTLCALSLSKNMNTFCSQLPPVRNFTVHTVIGVYYMCKFFPKYIRYQLESLHRKLPKSTL